MRLNDSGKFVKRDCKIVEASCVVVFEIVKQKPHPIAERIKPYVLKMAHIIPEKDAERKLALVSLSNSPIQRKIKDLSDDIKCQVIEQIKTAPFGPFAIQTTNQQTSLCVYSSLMVFAKYDYNDTL